MPAAVRESLLKITPSLSGAHAVLEISTKKCTILFPNVGRCKCKVPFAKLPATHLQIEKLSKLFNSIEKLETSKLSLDFQSAFTLASPPPAPQVSNVTAIFAICGDRQEPRLVMILVAKIKFSFPYSEPSN